MNDTPVIYVLLKTRTTKVLFLELFKEGRRFGYSQIMSLFSNI